MAHLILLERAKQLLTSAEFLHEEYGDDVAGAAGLAFQAIDLASKTLTEQIDGADAGGHQARMKRVQKIIRVRQTDLRAAWRARQRDFYGNTVIGGEAEPLSREEVVRTLSVAREIVRQIDEVLHPEAHA